jgi:hypothetical protein
MTSASKQIADKSSSAADWTLTETSSALPNKTLPCMRPRVNAGALVEASNNATDQAKRIVLCWDCISVLHFGTGSRIFSQALINEFHQNTPQLQ